MSEKLSQIRIYRANNNNNGFASSWQLSINQRDNNKYEPYNFFLSMAKQTGTDDKGNAQFDWKNAVNVKLSDFELGEIIAVFDGRKDSLGYKGNLYHTMGEGDSKIVKLDFVEEKNGFNLNISVKTKETQSSYYQIIGHGEAVVLSVMLKKAIEKMVGW